MIPSSILPAITRFVAQRFGDDGDLKQDSDSIGSLVRWANFAIVASAVVSYYFYLLSVAAKEGIANGAGIAWLCYVLGLVCNLNATAQFGVLNGIGEVGWDKVVRTTTSILGFAMTLGLLLGGLGIIGLGIAFLSQNLLSLGLARKLRAHFKTDTKLDGNGFAPTHRLFSESAKLLSLAGIGYLVMNSGTFVIERRFGPEMVAKYAPLIRVGALLANTALIITQTVYPYVAQSWSRRDFQRHRRLFIVGLLVAIAVYTAGALLMWIVAPVMFPLWLGAGRYLGPSIFGLILIVYGIFVTSVASSNPVLASIGSVFLGSAILNLVLVCPLLWVFTGRWGIIGAPIATVVGMIGPSTWIVIRSWNLMVNHRRAAT